MKTVTSSRELDYRWAPVTAISGIAGVVAYVFVYAAESVDAFAVTLAFIFALGITIGSIGLYHTLGGATSSPLSLFAAVTNTIAAALLLAMVMVQLSVKAMVPQPDDGLKAVWMGLDVAWDLYIGAGTILFGFTIFGRRGLGVWLALPGLLIGGLFLIFNIATFPKPPADAGLVDVGPLIGLWYLAVFGRLGVSSILLARQHRGTIVALEDSTGPN